MPGGAESTDRSIQDDRLRGSLLGSCPAFVIESAEARWEALRLPRAEFGHREKLGTDSAKHKDFSASHRWPRTRAWGLLLQYVAGRPDVTAQAQRLGEVMKEAGLWVTLFGAQKSTHTKLNADLGLPDDPATKALFEFLDKAMKK
jgi:arylformamidase